MKMKAKHCCVCILAFSGTLLDILRTYAIFVNFAFVPNHALGASTSRAATLLAPKASEASWGLSIFSKGF